MEMFSLVSVSTLSLITFLVSLPAHGLPHCIPLAATQCTKHQVWIVSQVCRVPGWVFQASGAASSYRGTCWTVTHVQLTICHIFQLVSNNFPHCVTNDAMLIIASAITDGVKKECVKLHKTSNSPWYNLFTQRFWSYQVYNLQAYPIFLTKPNNF